MQVTPRYDGPPVITSVGPSADVLAPLARQRRRLEAMLGGLTPAQWAAPSRCEDWTVQDVASHVAGVNGFWHASVQAGVAGAPTRYLVGFDPKATPALMVAGMRELAPADVLAQVAASNDRLLGLLATLDEDGWALPAEAPPGHLAIRLLAEHALWDAWIHERDIALPLGAVPPVEVDEVSLSLGYGAALSAGLALIGGERLDGSYTIQATDPSCCVELEVGDSVVIRRDALPGSGPALEGDAVGLLEALSLRGPLPASAPEEWVRLRSGLGRAFGDG